MIDVGQTVPHGNAGVGGEIEVAAYDEGAHVTFLDSKSSQMGKKETMVDTAKVLGRFFDGIEYVRAFVIGGDLKRAAGAGGGLLEEQNDVLAGEQVAADAGALLRLT